MKVSVLGEKNFDWGSKYFCPLFEFLIVIADKNGVQQPFIGASTIDTTIAQTGKENIEMNEIQSTFV